MEGKLCEYYIEFKRFGIGVRGCINKVIIIDDIYLFLYKLCYGCDCDCDKMAKNLRERSERIRIEYFKKLDVCVTRKEN